MKIDCYTESEIKSIIYNELVKRDKIMNKIQLKNLIKQEVTEQFKRINGELFNLRKEIRRLKEEMKVFRK